MASIKDKKKKKTIAEQIQESISSASEQYVQPWSSYTQDTPANWADLGKAVYEGARKKVEKDAVAKLEEEILKKRAEADGNKATIAEALKGNLPKGAVIDSANNKDLAKALTDERLRAYANGVDPNKAVDDRNALEKWLNLPKKQAWYWDVLEILGRPSKGAVISHKNRKENEEMLKSFDPELYYGLYTKSIKDPKTGELRPFKPGEESKWRITLDAKRLEAFRKKESEMDAKAKATGKTSTQGFIDGVAGRQKDSMIELIAQSKGHKKPTWGDIEDGLMYEIFVDPLNLIPGKALASAVQGVGKGIKGAANVTGITKLGEKIANSKVGKEVADTVDEAIITGGRNRNLHGDKVEDVIKELAVDSRAWADSTAQNFQDALVASAKVAGGLDKGKEVGKVAEFPLLQKQLDEATGNVAKFTDEAQSLQNQADTIKAMDGTYKGAPMDDALRATLKEVAPEAMRKVNIVEKSPYYTRFFGDADLTKELIKKKANMDKQLGKHYQELYKVVQGSDTVAKLEEAVVKVLTDPALAEAKVALDDVLKYYDEVKPLTENANYAQSAKLLQEGSSPIVQFANDIGIKMDEMEGYMPHVLTDKGKELFGIGTQPTIQAVNSTPTVGANQTASLSDRSWEVGKTAEQINTKYKNDIVEADAFKAFPEGVSKKIKALSLVDFLNKTLVLEQFALPAKVAEATIGTEKLSKTAKKLSIGNLTKNLDETSKAVLESSGLLKDDIYVTKGLYNEIDKFVKVIKDDELAKVHQWWRKATGYWKSLAVFSGIYHISNTIGTSINMYLRGMSLPEITMYMAKTAKTTKLYNKAIDKGFSNLTKAEQKAVEDIKRFRASGLSKSSQHSQTVFKQDDFMEQVAKRVAGKGTKNPLKINHKLAETMDDISRMAYHSWLLDEGKSAKEAQKLVRETLYDYRDLTKVEQGINADVIMFYSWLRKNVPFMMKQLYENPKKLYNIGKAQNLSLEAMGQDKELLPSYYQGAFGLTPDKIFSPNLPVQDLNKLAINPLETLASMSNPVVKLAFEQLSGRELFNKQPITDEKEHFISALLPPANRLFDGLAKAEKSGNPLDVLLSLTGNPVKDYDPEKFSQYIMRDDLKAIQKEVKKKTKDPITLDQLAKLGLVSQNQKNEQQLQSSMKLMEEATKLGLDPQVVQTLPYLKQKAMKSTKEELGDIVTLLRQYKVPDELIYEVVKDYKQLPTVPK